VVAVGAYRAGQHHQRGVLAALRLESLVPLTVDVRVADGIVTLTGTVGRTAVSRLACADSEVRQSDRCCRHTIRSFMAHP
jgi:hypothetical protein